MDVIYDTASDWLTIEGEQCGTCEGDTYAVSKSTTSVKVGSEYTRRTYGSTNLYGLEYTDQVCVTQEACLSDFEFFLVLK